MQRRPLNANDYSDKYQDDKFEYRHVILPEEYAMVLPSDRVLTEDEWRTIVPQSQGWENYMIHRPERHILLFRRPLGTDPATGKIDPNRAEKAKETYSQELSKRIKLK